jgi:hypothetical protein
VSPVVGVPSSPHPTRPTTSTHQSPLETALAIRPPSPSCQRRKHGTCGQRPPE